MSLPINEDFVSIQGEGTHTGIKMYFVRLQGCTVGCHFCDTKHSWRPETSRNMTETEIVRRALESGTDWLCITGGEPAEHDCRALISLARIHRLNIQVESSGIGNIRQFKDTHLVISPKERFTRKKNTNLVSIVEYAKELKCVVCSLDDMRYYQDTYKRLSKYIPSCLVPVSNDKQLMKEMIDELDVRWRIRIQQHAVMNIR